MSSIGKLASWMMQHGYATGHGESVDDLLAELTWQIEEKIEMEREACAKEIDKWIGCDLLAAAIRARSK